MARARRPVRTQRDTTLAKPTNGQRDLAWRAVQNFNKMIPTLTTFARALTGNQKLLVRAGKVTETDPKTVWLRPPLSLGETLQHDRTLCDRRDGNKILLCPACRRADDIWRKLHHELAHVLGKSLTNAEGPAIDELENLVREFHPTNACGHAAHILRDMRSQASWPGKFGAFSPFMTMIWNSVEDARIDRKMLTIKPGLRNQFYANTYLTFVEGCENDDGEKMLWRDSPISAQVIVGLMLIGAGYKIDEDWLRRETLDILADPELVDIMSHPESWPDVHSASARAIQAFRRLVSLGFLNVNKCEKEESPAPSLGNPGKETESDGDEDSTDAGDDSNSSGDDAESGSSESDAGSGVEPGDDSSDPDSDDSDSDGSGSDGLGDGDGDSPAEPEAPEESRPTGDGTPGDTAESSATGTDQDAGGNGDGEEDESSDDSSGGAGVPSESGDGDESRGVGGSDSSDDDHGDDSSDDSPEGDVHSVGSDRTEAQDDAGDPGAEASGSGDSESSDADEPADADGDDAAQVGDGDVPGEPGDEHDGARSAGRDDSEDEGSEGQSDGDGSHDEVSDNGSESQEDGSTAGGDLTSENPGDETDGEADYDLEDPEENRDRGEPMGESVWDEPNPEVPPANSFTPEELGDPFEIEKMLEAWHGHEEYHDLHDSSAIEQAPDDEITPRDKYDDETILAARNVALEEAVRQVLFFDKASVGVGGVVEYEFPTSIFQWTPHWRGNRCKDYMPTEAIIGSALLKARAVFAENNRSGYRRHLKSGKVDGRVLGRRAVLGDDRLFRHREMPKKRDYVVGITVDCSGSTGNAHRMERIKRAVFAKAELLNRLGIKFYITGHTGGKESFWTLGYVDSMANDPSPEQLMILWIKKPDEPWNDTTRERLATLAPLANNFDGHTLEFHRKILERRRESDKVLIYYTDGAMPAANYEEELVVLTTELNTLRKMRVATLAVGINTDSPKEYGFDTVQVDSDSDLVKVVEQLERALVG